MKQQAAKYLKGYHGERKLDYHLKGLPDHYSILSDITLIIFGKKVQIDSFIITPFAIFLLDVKSFEGTVTFDTILKQFVQDNGKTLKGYKYPLTQGEKIQYYLHQWLQSRNISSFPIYYFIAFSESSTIINVKGDEDTIGKVVSYIDDIPLRLMKLNENISKNRIVNLTLKNKVVRAIMRECEDFDYDILATFDIKKNEILPGVHCQQCENLGMERLHGKGRCYKCGAYSKDAYLKGLQDYILLISKTITNKACREFLQLNDRHEALHIIKSSHLFIKKSRQIWMKK
ncbi:nuclease-related domain-containing protein [Pseudogracilibacillus auburnensis]|uniref:nuclease-related domain-containing protein n=1 Tax=Pseudogracilibacillus auburnensis TaxID=1494959 RepID=UPI001FD10980|nr:nuclease-related domain-containing protein [Pseudogracilibacillus auburnensis]